MLGDEQTDESVCLNVKQILNKLPQRALEEW